MRVATAYHEQLTEQKMHDALSWAYKKALRPDITDIYSAYDLAEDHEKNRDGSETDVPSLMRWLNAKAAAAVFLCGNCGLIKIPEGFPANVSSVLFTQIRIIAALAIISGLDVRNDKVRALVCTAVCGDAAKDILTSTGIELHQKISMVSLNNLSIQALTELNRKVCFRLIAVLSKEGVLCQGEIAPFAGKIVGKTFNALDSIAVVKAAKEIFVGGSSKTSPIRIFSKAS